jgi:hypothetical protein
MNPQEFQAKWAAVLEDEDFGGVVLDSDESSLGDLATADDVEAYAEWVEMMTGNEVELRLGGWQYKDNPGISQMLEELWNIWCAQ